MRVPRRPRSAPSKRCAAAAFNKSNVTRIIVADARQLRIDHGLKTLDAMHVATAAFGRADVLLTNDDKVHRVGSFKGMPIRRPDWPGDLPLDFGSPDI